MGLIEAQFLQAVPHGHVVYPHGIRQPLHGAIPLRTQNALSVNRDSLAAVHFVQSPHHQEAGHQQTGAAPVYLLLPAQLAALLLLQADQAWSTLPVLVHLPEVPHNPVGAFVCRGEAEFPDILLSAAVAQLLLQHNGPGGENAKSIFLDVLDTFNKKGNLWLR